VSESDLQNHGLIKKRNTTNVNAIVEKDVNRSQLKGLQGKLGPLPPPGICRLFPGQIFNDDLRLGLLFSISPNTHGVRVSDCIPYMYIYSTVGR